MHVPFKHRPYGTLTGELALHGAARVRSTHGLRTACATETACTTVAPSASPCLAEPHTALFQEHSLLLHTLELTAVVPELTALQPSAPAFFFFFLLPDHKLCVVSLMGRI